MGAIALKKRVFGAMILSLAVGAVLGVAAVLSDLGEIGTKVLLTTWIISGVSLLALAPAVQVERGRHLALSYLGGASALASGGMLTAMIWAESSSEPAWRWTVVLGLLALGCSHACLLLLGSLSERYRPALWAAIVLGFAFVGQLIWSVLAEQEPVWKLLSVNAILVTTVSLSVLVFHRLSAIELSQARSGGQAGTLHCPCCSCAVEHGTSGACCKSCGCEFVIKAPGKRDAANG